MTKVVRVAEGKYKVVDNGVELEVTKIDLYKGRHVMKLPENSANRQYLDCKYVDEAPNQELELAYKPTRTITKSEKSTTKSQPNPQHWQNFLTDEEKITYEELKAKALKRQQLDEAKKEYEAKKAEYEKLVKELEEAVEEAE